jgi:hypothetical protein
MADFGGFLGALGNAFVGYGEDQKRRTLDARNARLDEQNTQLHAAQMRNYDAEAQQRNARTAQEATMRTPEFEDTYYKARMGDVHAQAQVVRIVAGHPNETAILAPFTKTAPSDPIAVHAANRDYDNAHLPPPTASQRFQEAAAARAERSARLQAARTNLDEVRRGIPRPSTVPRMALGKDAKGRPDMVENPAYAAAISDSTKYEREQMDPARKNLTEAVGAFGFGRAQPAPADTATRVSPEDRAHAARDPKFKAWLIAKGAKL